MISIDIKKYGYIHEEPTGDEEIFGVGEMDEVLSPLRDYTPFLAEKEVQNKFHETWNCTVFSMLNCLETLAKVKYKIDINKSDRFVGKMGGTHAYSGNTFRESYNALPNFGWVDEKDYPFDSKTVEEYYKTVPPEILKKGEESKKYFEFRRKILRTVTPETLWEALQFGPLRVSVCAWYPPIDGVYERVNGILNHAVMLFKGEFGKYWWIYDSYDKDIKKLAWDFNFGSADFVSFKLKSMSNDFVKIVKDINSSAVGFFIPAISPDALTSMALAYNKEIVKKEGGGIDWPKTIEGTVDLKADSI